LTDFSACGWLEICPGFGALRLFITCNINTVIFQNPMKLTHLLMENVMSIYKQHGFDSRKAYLISIAEDYGIQESAVFLLSQMLGAGEDFDGLISHLNDLEFTGEFSND
jgi:hypothetical protein